MISVSTQKLPTMRWLLARCLGGRVLRVVGGSMSPTLEAGDLVLVDERAYRKRSPIRKDLVVAQPAALGGIRLIVKRIAALPGESVAHGGEAMHLGTQEVFLLSDCQEPGCDSRTFGPVRLEELLGPVTRRLWPPARLPSPRRPTAARSAPTASPPRRSC